MNPSQILNNLALYSLQIGLLVGLAALAPGVLRLRLPGAKLAYWHCLLAACLLLPALRPWKQDVVNISITAPARLFSADAVNAVRAQDPMFTTTGIILAVLAAGMLARLTWLAVGLWRLRRYRRHGLPYRAPLEAALPAFASRIPNNGTARTKAVDLRLSEDVMSPVTFGLRNPVVLLPVGFPELAAPVREAILAHECLHVERRDWLFTLLEELVRAVFWFHPAIWWLLGEIQLAREQAVDRAAVAITKGREEYVDALLAIAGAKPQLDLAPAPLFLRKRHLKQRVVSILKEAAHSRRQAISALAVGLCVLAGACWLVTGAFPLAASPQVVMDDAGVTVDAGGASLMHRAAVAYPEGARTKQVQGTVLLEVKLDSAGNVADAHVISGPDELRRAALQSVLQWHFSKDVAGSVRQVSIGFVLPNTSPEPSPTAVPSSALAERIPTVSAETTSRQNDASSNPSKGLVAKADGMPRFASFATPGLSEQARNELLSSLPVRVGDDASPQNFRKLSEAITKFDDHLVVTFSLRPPEERREMQVQISAPRAAATPPDSGPPQRIRVGGNVQAANVVKKVPPVYPILAKAARIQGMVVLNVLIGPAGSVMDVTAVSGNPLLVPAAIDAVKDWQYRPTLLNGNPVEVDTEVQVNFTLEQ